jgi:purine-binding chemotaxis protein CheW
VPGLNELLDAFFYRPDEDAGPLFELAEAVEPVSAAQEEQPEEFLAFALTSETYAVPVALLREIVKVPTLTEVPRAPASLLGVMDLRGEVMPVYDIKTRLRLPPTPRLARPEVPASAVAKASRLLVVRSEGGDAAIFVDQVLGVVRLRPSTIEPAPPGIGGGEHEYITGIGRRGEALYILLDVEQCLT